MTKTTNTKPSSSSKKPSARRDLYQEITDRIVEALEKGVAPWVRPWSEKADASWRSRSLPYNGHTGHFYRGCNVLLLWCEMQARGFDDPRFYSYKQAALRGGQVRRGEQGTSVVFFMPLTKKEKNAKTGKDETKRIPLLRAYTVFNRSQIDWAKEEFPHADPEPSAPKFDEAQKLVRASGASIRHRGNRACYLPGPDRIDMPTVAQFADEGAYFATLLHELTHWTGHETRCKRQFGKRFGDDAYAAEELVAELGSAFLCAHANVVGKLQHPEYIGHWLKVLKGDKYAVFTASREAQKAADFVFAKAGDEASDDADATAQAA